MNDILDFLDNSNPALVVFILLLLATLAYFALRQLRHVPKIYVCSPFAGQGPDERAREADNQRNIQFALDVCRRVSRAGAVVFAPHLFFTRFLDDADEVDRTLGIKSGLAIMEGFDEVWFIVPKWRCGFSRGMLSEHAEATGMGKVTRVLLTEAEVEIAIADLKARVRRLDVRPV